MIAETDKQTPVWVQMRGCDCAPPAGWSAAPGSTEPLPVDDAAGIDPATLGANTRPILAYRACVPFLTRAMADGVPPSRALQIWLEAAQEIAALHRRLRRSALLVEASGIEVQPESAAAALGLAAAGQQGPGAEPATGHMGSMTRLIAMQTLARSTRARRLDAELEASATPVPGAEPGTAPIDADRVFEELIDASPGARAVAAVPVSAHPGNQSGAQAENGILQQRLLQLQKELEEGFVASGDASLRLEAELEHVQQLQVRITALEAELRTFMTSKSWRLTEPLRGARRLFSFRRQG